MQSAMRSLIGFYEIIPPEGLTSEANLKNMEADFDRVNITVSNVTFVFVLFIIILLL